MIKQSKKNGVIPGLLIIEDPTYHGPKRRFPTTQLPRATFKNSEGLKFQRTGQLRDASY